MKKATAIIFILFLASIKLCFSQWQWAKNFGGGWNDYGQKICIDSFGNKYITGYFSSDSTAFGSFILRADGFNMYVAKLDANGNVLWARCSKVKFGVGKGYGIATDINKNVFVVGSFEGDSIEFDGIKLSNEGSEDMFIVKYDSMGSVLWAKSAGRFSSDISNSVTIDGNGNAYVTGHFSSYIVFGNDTLQNSGGYDVFIVKYDPLGNVIWATSAKNSTGNDDGNSIRFDVNNNVFYLTGYYNGSSIKFGNTPTLSGGTVFIAKYDVSGNAIWAVTSINNVYNYGNGITVDNIGNILVVGTFDSPQLILGSKTLKNSSYGNFFVTKLDPSGTFLWAAAPDSSSPDNFSFGYDISVDQNGNSYITGNFAHSTFKVDTTILNNAGTGGLFNLYIIKYSSLGNLIWARTYGGTLDEYGYGIAVSANGVLNVTGHFNSSTLNFDNLPIHSSGSVAEIFVASGSIATGILDLDASNTKTHIFPNPSYSNVNISFEIKQKSVVSLEIYNSIGEKIESVIELEEMNPGIHYFQTKQNKPGIYFFRSIINGIPSSYKFIKLD